MIQRAGVGAGDSESQAGSRRHSHSMVAGGFVEMSYTTRFTPLTSFIILLDIWPSTSKGMCEKSAVMKSVVSTARMAMTFS